MAAAEENVPKEQEGKQSLSLKAMAICKWQLDYGNHGENHVHRHLTSKAADVRHGELTLQQRELALVRCWSPGPAAARRKH